MPNVAGGVAIAAACEALASREALLAEEERLLGPPAGRPGRAAGRHRAQHLGASAIRESGLWRSPWTAGRRRGRPGHCLSRDYGIGVRMGRFCAHLLVDRLADRGGAAVRASIGLGTVDEHVDRLLSALAVLSGPPGPRGSRPANRSRRDWPLWRYRGVQPRAAPTVAASPR